MSPSVLYKIKNMRINEIFKGPTRNYTKILTYNKENLIKWIKEYINSTNYPFNAVELTEIANEKLRTNYSVNLIRKILKFDLNMSFKRVMPRPNSIDLNRVKVVRQKFVEKFLQEVTIKSLIINIDESSINRHIKTNYSWSLKGTNKEVVNSPFSGSLSMIMSICSNGSWIGFVTNTTINSQKIKNFLDNLHKWLKDHLFFGYDDVIVVLDNWSIHKTVEVKKMLSKIWAKTIYLPPYSPQFAPIETFFRIFKKILMSKFKYEHMNLNDRNNLSQILQSLKSIKCETVKKLFINMYSSIKSWL